MKTEFHPGRRRLPLVLLGNALMRIAGGAGGVLVGLYLVDLANRGSAVDATLVGVLGAVSFAAELLGALIGSLLAGVLGERFPVDGLIHGTVAMAVIALLAVEWLKHLAVELPAPLTYREEQL